MVNESKLNKVLKKIKSLDFDLSEGERGLLRDKFMENKPTKKGEDLSKELINRRPKEMNKKIYDLLENEINTYKATVGCEFDSNGAIFSIFDNFFHELKSNKKLSKECGISLNRVMYQNLPQADFYIPDSSLSEEGISCCFTFDDVEYTIRFKSFRDGMDMIYRIQIKSTEEVKYSNDFIFKYALYNALGSSNLKGSYFTMPRDSFDWDIRTIEGRTFDDIYLPNEIMEDLHLYVDIYGASDKLLRYLKVGNPGVGKTESTIVIANELNKTGVTIIKTPICEKLHQKVELANVLAPSLIIFDDIDLSLGDRNKGAYSKLLGDFLDVLDGTDKLSNDVGVIATTNAAHLLDLAAQRPGRFDKTLLFDNITKGNIRDIIIKSLKYNFNITKGKELELYTDQAIVDKFYDSGVTGSHVYNSIKMLKLRYDTLKIKDVTVKRVIDSITSELETIEKVRKVSYLKDKYDRGTGKIGFGRGDEGKGFIPSYPKWDGAEEVETSRNTDYS